MGAAPKTGKVGPAEYGTSPGSLSGAPSLEVNVVFTSDRGTVAALQAAGNLARQLSARIRLLVTQVVPYALPLDHPQVSIDFLRDRCRRLAAECPEAAEIRINIYLCRNRCQVLKRGLSASSLVIIGGKQRWWPTAEQKLAKALEAQGHHVIFAPSRSAPGPAGRPLAEEAPESDQSVAAPAKLAWDGSIRADESCG